MRPFETTTSAIPDSPASNTPSPSSSENTRPPILSAAAAAGSTIETSSKNRRAMARIMQFLDAAMARRPEIPGPAVVGRYAK
jgi:hypothetical protein